MKLTKYLILAALISQAAFAVTPPSTAVTPPSTEGECVGLTRSFWIEVFEKRNADVAMDYLSNTYIQHVAPPQPPIEEWVAVWRDAFSIPAKGDGKNFPEAQSNFTTDIVSVIGNDDYAVLRAHDYGVWDNTVAIGDPMEDHKAGEKFDFHYYDIFRCADGKLQEHWYSEDPDLSVGL